MLTMAADPTSLLLEAVGKGDLDGIRQGLDTGVDVNAEYPQGRGRTPLWLACSKGNIQVVRLLVERGAEVDQPLSSGFTALMAACQVGHLEVTKLLLDLGADVTSMTFEDEITALHLACKAGHAEVVRKLLATEKCDIDIKDAERRTPLHSAVMSKKLDIVQLVVEGGASMPNADTTEMTPLHHACEYGMRDVAEYLLDKGHPVNVGNGAEQGTPLAIAARGQNEDLIRLLLVSKANVNSKDAFGCSVLYNTKALNIAKLLLAEGCDVNVICRGKHLVDHAIQRNQCDLALLYYKSNADPSLIRTPVDVMTTKCPELAQLYQKDRNRSTEDVS